MNTEVAQAIVAQVSREIGRELVFVRNLPNSDSIEAKDRRGCPHAIVCYGSSFAPVVRAVLRPVRRGRYFGWLPNGQAARNAREVARWDEDHRYLLTAKQAAQVICDGLVPDVAIRERRAGGVMLPPHLTIDAVRAAIRQISTVAA